jgi:hypothetical protein
VRGRKHSDAPLNWDQFESKPSLGNSELTIPHWGDSDDIGRNLSLSIHLQVAKLPRDPIASIEPVSDQSSKVEVTPEQSLKEPAKIYLLKLLNDIATMLSYANRNGIPLPDDLRGKIDELLNKPEVKGIPFSFTNYRIADQWRLGS